MTQLLPTKNGPFPEFIERSEAHKRAVEFMKSSTAKEGVEYEWVWDYAKGLWEHRSRVFDALDGKANSIITYLGGGTGLFALGVLSKVDKENVYLVYCTLPAVITAIAALFCAAWAKKPNFAPAPPTIQDAVTTYAEHAKEAREAKAAFLGQWNLACEDMRLACLQKARYVECATWCYFGAIALLCLPVLVAAIHPPMAAKDQPAAVGQK